MKDCHLCKQGHPHTHYVLIPIRDAKTNEMKMLQVKEGSDTHKQLLEIIKHKQAV